MDDVRNHGIQEVSVVRDDQDGGLPRLWEESQVLTLVTFASVSSEEC